MVSNRPLGVYVKTGPAQNGKQEYQISLPNRNGEIETRAALVDEKNVDKFDRLNVDCVITANEINRKMAKGSLIGTVIGGAVPLASFILLKKNKFAGALLGVLFGVVGAVAGMFTGSYLAAKKAIPQAKEHIEENEQQMMAMMENPYK